VLQLADQGELDAILGNTPAALPSITLTDAAKGRILSVIEDNEPRLRLRIDARFSYQFEHADEPESSDVSVDVGGLVLILDRVSARRADGMTMDYVTSPRGSGLVVDNPNEPPSVQQLSVEDFQRWHDEGRAFHLFDVRTEMEWNIARLDGAVLLDDDGQAALEALPKDAPIVFLCHHGVRSQHAAEHFLAGGYRNVFNLTGGIDAWSMRIDPSVPRY
jgi:monothiol glutaredoxin